MGENGQFCNNVVSIKNVQATQNYNIQLWTDDLFGFSGTIKSHGYYGMLCSLGVKKEWEIKVTDSYSMNRNEVGYSDTAAKKMQLKKVNQTDLISCIYQ